MLRRVLLVVMALCTVFAVTFVAQAEVENGHKSKPATDAPHTAGMVMTDNRTLVHYPDMLRVHTLANMRDHLLTISEIQAALANNEFDKASEIAEQRLGMSSLKLHGAHKVAKYMPKRMQQLGTAMHRSASQFAVVASNAAVNGHVKPALIALSRVTQSCVACHSSFRLH